MKYINNKNCGFNLQQICNISAEYNHIVRIQAKLYKIFNIMTSLTDPSWIVVLSPAVSQYGNPAVWRYDDVLRCIMTSSSTSCQLKRDWDVTNKTTTWLDAVPEYVPWLHDDVTLWRHLTSIQPGLIICKSLTQHPISNVSPAPVRFSLTNWTFRRPH